MQLDLRRRLFIVLVLGAALIGLLAVFFAFGGRVGSVTVEIVVVPTDSTLTIEGEKVKPGNITLDKGKHTLKATREHFADTVKEIDTETLDLSEPLYVTLEPNSPKGKQYLLDNPDQQLLRERAYGQEFSNTQESLLDRYPVITSLPYTTIDYKIDYEVTKDKDVHFMVKLYPVATRPGTDLYKQQLNNFKESALEWLSDQGLDVGRATITFSPDPDN